MTLNQYKRAMIAFRAEMAADNSARFQQWQRQRGIKAAGFAARAKAAREQRDAMAARLHFVEAYAARVGA